MSKGKIAASGPFAVAVEAGRDYYWCRCGLSQSQPFCDGSHKATDLAPARFTAQKSETVYFCGCKQSGSSPLCDGTHRSL